MGLDGLGAHYERLGDLRVRASFCDVGAAPPAADVVTLSGASPADGGLQSRANPVSGAPANDLLSTLMRYVLLLHHPEELRHLPGTEAFLDGLAAFDAFHAELARRGVAWDGEPLQPTQTATSVRVRDGETLVVDGRAQGATRRLLRHRRREPRRRHRSRPHGPMGQGGHRRDPAACIAGHPGARLTDVTNPVHASLERLVRDDAARIVATLARSTGSLDLAEDALQDAFAAAATAWPRTGVPEDPAPWIFVVARRRAIDRLRRADRTLHDTEVMDALETDAQAASNASSFPDERLELLYGCCHPSLALESQVALTLHSLGGLSTGEVAAAFRTSEATMAQRLVRARRRLREIDAVFALPTAAELPSRLDAVLGVLFLIFNEGYASNGHGPLLRVDLCEEAIRLARLLAVLLPEEPEVAALAALMLFHDARRNTRVDQAGTPVPLDEQDRGRWDARRISEADALLERALGQRRRSSYVIEACIAALHAQAQTADATDWQQIALLYRLLAAERPGLTVRLAWIAAVGMSDGPEPALRLLDALDRDKVAAPDLGRADSLRAELLRRAGRITEARRAYAAATDGSITTREERFIAARLVDLDARG